MKSSSLRIHIICFHFFVRTSSAQFIRPFLTRHTIRKQHRRWTVLHGPLFHTHFIYLHEFWKLWSVCFDALVAVMELKDVHILTFRDNRSNEGRIMLIIVPPFLFLLPYSPTQIPYSVLIKILVYPLRKLNALWPKNYEIKYECFLFDNIFMVIYEINACLFVGFFKTFIRCFVWRSHFPPIIEVYRIPQKNQAETKVCLFWTMYHRGCFIADDFWED